jgi:hypothetical protein
MFQRVCQSKISEFQILLHLFVAHTILQMVDFTEFMAQKDGKDKLKQTHMKIFGLFFGDNSEEKA